MRPHDTAHVYFAIGEKDGRKVIKLGSSTNVEKRVKYLSRYVDGDLRLLGVLPLASRAKERMLHARFQRFRLPASTIGPTTEWFDADPEIVYYATRHGLAPADALNDGADGLRKEASQLRRQADALRKKAREMDGAAKEIDHQAKLLQRSWFATKDQLTTEVAP